jgi:hypothetical protein
MRLHCTYFNFCGDYNGLKMNWKWEFWKREQMGVLEKRTPAEKCRITSKK